MTCGKVALLLRLDPEFVAELAETWNPRFRRITYTNQYVTRLTVRQYFESGSMLATICRDLQMPLFTVISHLCSEGVTDQQMTSRMPDRTDPLYIAYRKTVKTPREQKAQTHPVALNILNLQHILPYLPLSVAVVLWLRNGLNLYRKYKNDTEQHSKCSVCRDAWPKR